MPTDDFSETCAWWTRTRSNQRSRRWLLPLLVFSAVASPAQVKPQALRWACDLDGDGASEVVTAKPAAAETDHGLFYRIEVTNAKKAVIWTSPDVADPAHPLAFGEWHFGLSMPQVVGDLDGDGAMKMIVPAPQSDVGPTAFRVFEWMEDQFVPLFSESLVGGAAIGADFQWTLQPRDNTFFVQAWLGSDPAGGWLVKLVKLDNAGNFQSGVGVLTPAKGGFKLTRWVNEPLPPDPPQATAPATPSPQPAVRTRGAATIYQARLSRADHVNSAGVRLSNVADILRQDRSNFHRGVHRDAEDQSDAVFATVGGRQRFATLPVRVTGTGDIDATLRRGTPLVEVSVLADRINVRILKP